MRLSYFFYPYNGFLFKKKKTIVFLFVISFLNLGLFFIYTFWNQSYGCLNFNWYILECKKQQCIFNPNHSARPQPFFLKFRNDLKPPLTHDTKSFKNMLFVHINIYFVFKKQLLTKNRIILNRNWRIESGKKDEGLNNNKRK